MEYQITSQQGTALLNYIHFDEQLFKTNAKLKLY